jgi:hypothetical protein
MVTVASRKSFFLSRRADPEPPLSETGEGGRGMPEIVRADRVIMLEFPSVHGDQPVARRT